MNCKFLSWLNFLGCKARKYDGNSEGSKVGTSDGETPGLIDITILGVADSFILGKNFYM